MMRNIHKTVNTELRQAHETRKQLFKKIEKKLKGRKLVTFFTSFSFNVDISDDDCDMLQSILQTMDLSNGLALMVSSPGGDGLAAERIVNTCRAYSGTGDYWVIVPGKAKSAATIICMGASKIMMSSSSELGPVDPQILRIEDGRRKVFSAHNIVSSYDKLFNEAVSSTGRLEPYLQQLEHFDDRDITTYRSLIKLSEDISIKILRSGMMKNLNEADVRDKIKVFLIPDAGTLIHGRPIYLEEVSSCGLKTETLDVKDSLWRSVYDLYTRTEWFVSLQVGKAVESEKESFYAQAPDR